MEAPISPAVQKLLKDEKTGRELVKRLRENRNSLIRKTHTIKLGGRLYSVKKLGK